MALQRAGGLSAAQVVRFAGRCLPVQPLSGGRSPLYAVALGVEKKLFGGACVKAQDQTHRSQRR